MFLEIDRHPPGRLAAVGDDGGALTYADLAAFTGELAGHLPPRRLLFLLCENTVGSLAGYVAALSLGAVPLLLDAGMDSGLLARLVAIYRPSFLWRPLAAAAGEEAPVHTCFGYGLFATGAAGFALHPDLALLVATSGSTGSPKLVRQSYAGLAANAASIAEYLEIDEGERPITTLPMQYVYGLSVVNSHLLRGARLLLTRCGVLQRAFWAFFREQGASALSGVPYTYEMLMKLRFFDMDLPSLRTLTQAGGKLPTALHGAFARWAQETGRRFIVMYGASEATARMGWLPPDLALSKQGAMGVAIPGGAFWLEADGGRVETAGAVGELVYRGPNVALGYAECGEDLARGDDFGGELHTGDLAIRDEEGVYTIVGRKRRFVKLFGNRVSLDEVERLVGEAFDTDCAAAGRDDHLVVWVTAVSPQAVRDHLARRMGVHPSGIEARRVDALPRSAAGKVLYGALEDFGE